MQNSGKPLLHQLLHQHLYLLPQKAIYWQDQRMLILADAHLDKVNHFRKAGFALPALQGHPDLETMEALLQLYEIDVITILGDLFHSKINRASIECLEWFRRNESIDFNLVTGNHDLYTDVVYQSYNIKPYRQPLTFGPFVFTHVPLADKITLYNFSGHLHPLVQLSGTAKQSLKLPCFYLRANTGILPAFGAFTGGAVVLPEGKDQVFAVAGDEVIHVLINK